MTLEDRIRAMETLDMAGLLGAERNELHDLILRGERSEGERRIGWWEEAFGACLGEAAELARTATGHPEAFEAAQEFARSQRFRRAGMALLGTAVAARQQDQFRRLKCLAWAYGREVCRYLRHLAEMMRLTEQRSAFEAARDPTKEKGYPVLRAHLVSRAGKADSGATQVVTSRARHQLTRGASVLAEIATLEGERARLLVQLREVAACLPEGDGPSDNEETGATLARIRRELVAAERRVRNLERAELVLETKLAGQKAEDAIEEVRTRLREG